jgi:hypothetical protein
MYNVKFYTVAEKTPKFKEAIVFFRVAYSFGSIFPEFQEGHVEYTWVEIDEDGYECGNAVTYYENDTCPEGYRLVMDVGHNRLDEKTLWCPINEFYPDPILLVGDEYVE